MLEKVLCQLIYCCLSKCEGNMNALCVLGAFKSFSCLIQQWERRIHTILLPFWCVKKILARISESQVLIRKFLAPKTGSWKSIASLRAQVVRKLQSSKDFRSPRLNPPLCESRMKSAGDFSHWFGRLMSAASTPHKWKPRDYSDITFNLSFSSLFSPHVPLGNEIKNQPLSEGI
jgi:hypothetical protein